MNKVGFAVCCPEKSLVQTVAETSITLKMSICPHVCVFIGSMNNILTQVEPQLEESPGERRGSRAYQVLWLISSAAAWSRATLGLFSWTIIGRGEALPQR